MTALFISERDPEVAERFVAHEAVHAYKAALGIQKHAKRLGVRPYTPRQLARIKSAYDTALARYAPPSLKSQTFSNDFGWASAALANPRPTFADIELAVAMDHWRPYYKLASQPVHAAVRSITQSLALPRGSSLIHTGPSNFGLLEPAHSAALSLHQLTLTLLNLQPSIDGITISKAMGLLVKTIGHTLIESNARLRRKAAQQQGRLRKRPTRTE